MAISTGNVIHFFGTQDALDDTSGAVADNAFSVAGDLLTWTNDDDAPMASLVLEANYSVAPDANSYVALYAQLLNISSTNDGDVPDANNQHVYLGSFPVNDVTTAQYIPIDVSLPNQYTSQQYQFFIENQTGQSIPAGWDLSVTPKTVGAHA